MEDNLNILLIEPPQLFQMEDNLKQKCNQNNKD